MTLNAIERLHRSEEAERSWTALAQFQRTLMFRRRGRYLRTRDFDNTKYA
jgi:hypothetical protein